MKVLLALFIPGWLGFAGGALSDNAIPGFWVVWTIIGIILAVVTTIYIIRRRSS